MTNFFLTQPIKTSKYVIFFFYLSINASTDCLNSIKLRRYYYSDLIINLFGNYGKHSGIECMCIEPIHLVILPDVLAQLIS